MRIQCAPVTYMKFRYKARDSSGRLIKGEGEAATATGIAELLRQKKQIPISISEYKSWDLKEVLGWKGNVGAGEVATFTRQLSTMVTAGLPITDALNLLRVQSLVGLSTVVSAVITDVQGGVSLSEAMSRHPQVFSRVYVALVRAGEAAGVMEKVMSRLADTLDKSREFRGKVMAAMIYPAIILFGMVAVMVIMVVVVIPKLSALYQDFGATLPLPTQILLWISGFVINYWWIILIGVVGAVVGVRAYLKTPVGRTQVDRLIYRIPIWGSLAQQVMLTELTRTLSLLISAGVAVVEALEIVAGTMANVVVEADMRRIGKQVEKGFPLSIAFSESELFPPIVGQMVAVGEETGRMDDVLEKLSRYFESESDLKVKGLTTAIEPLIILVLAVGVGFLMYAVIMPIYDITNKI